MDADNQLVHVTRDRSSIAQRGARGGLVDYAASLAKLVFGFAIWFLTGGLVGPGYSRSRVSAFILVRILFVGGLVVLLAWGLAHPALAAVIFGALFLAGLYLFLGRSYARDAMYLAATRDLGGALPLQDRSVSAPRWLAARPLQQLALGLDRVRRGDVNGADRAIQEIDEGHLAVDERRMLAAIRSLRCEALRDRKGATIFALDAFPTGALEIDERLGRICVEAAWHDGVRLSAIVAAWQGHGIHDGEPSPLGELLRFMLVRLGRLGPEALDENSKQRLTEYARNFGDLATVNLVRAAPRSLVSPGSYR